MNDLFKYNPPPWEVRVCRDARHNVNSYDVCLQAEPDATGVGVVASVYAGEELARLIAAAPELYEALSDIMENPLFQTAIGGNPNMVEALMARANAALAKARGEA